MVMSDGLPIKVATLSTEEKLSPGQKIATFDHFHQQACSKMSQHIATISGVSIKGGYWWSTTACM